MNKLIQKKLIRKPVILREYATYRERGFPTWKPSRYDRPTMVKPQWRNPILPIPINNKNIDEFNALSNDGLWANQRGDLNCKSRTSVQNEMVCPPVKLKLSHGSPLKLKVSIGPPLKLKVSLGPPMKMKVSLGPPLKLKVSLGPPVKLKIILGPPA